jgi:hypothetical protein
MHENLLELLELVDGIKLYIADGLYTIEVRLRNGLFMDYDNLSLEELIDDTLTDVKKAS